MITIYGIKNCDTMQKALKWLSANNLTYTFHDYKVSGIDKNTIAEWLKHYPADKVINTKGTTFRGLTDIEKAGIVDKQAAIALMIKNPSLIKRPMWHLGKGNYFLGWNEIELAKLLYPAN